MDKLEKIVADTELLAVRLMESLPTQEQAIVTSMVYVRQVEENKQHFNQESYHNLLKHHDTVMKPYGVKYADVLFRLVGEGYHI